VRTKPFKLSSPLDQPREIRRSISESRQADQLAEHAVMRAFAVFRAIKFPNRDLSREQAKIVERLDRATDQLGDARAALGDAVYQMEQVLREAGVG